MVVCVVGDGGDSHWLGYSRSDLLLSLSERMNERIPPPCCFPPEWACSTTARTFFIYPSAFPAGARESELLSPLPRAAGADFTRATIFPHRRYWGAAFCFPHSVVPTTQMCPDRQTFPSR